MRKVLLLNTKQKMLRTKQLQSVPKVSKIENKMFLFIHLGHRALHGELLVKLSNH